MSVHLIGLQDGLHGSVHLLSIVATVASAMS